MKARKKPVVVNVLQYKEYNLKEALDFCCYAFVSRNDEQLYIDTLEGNMRVSKGDYIIEGVNGEYYPCKPDIFKKTYDLLEEGTK